MTRILIESRDIFGVSRGQTSETRECQGWEIFVILEQCTGTGTGTAGLITEEWAWQLLAKQNTVLKTHSQLIHCSQDSMAVKISFVSSVYCVSLSKRGGKDGVFQGLAGMLRGISRGAALPAQGKPRPSRFFYLDLHSISNRFLYWPS